MTIFSPREPEQSQLGKKTVYNSIYDLQILFPISRNVNRLALGINPDHLPFYGVDHWNHYEVSWLNKKGKPVNALAKIIYGCESPNIIEAKSMKLYFNSLNNTKFNNLNEVETMIKNDLSERIGLTVTVAIMSINTIDDSKIYRGFRGNCIDDIEIECSNYNVDSSYLFTEIDTVEEVLYSDLLKSNCLVTGQPDWGSIQIKYKGRKINHAGLLKYIVSYRNHSEFNEQCVERVFIDILQRCKPEELTVSAKYTRRGGLDINPYRSTKKSDYHDENLRLFRQ